MEIQEIKIKSTIDGSEEPSLFDCPPGDKRPLLVGLHSWSFGRENSVKKMLQPCRDRGWALLLPEFRGPNLADNPRAPQACGSRLARQDIVDAVEHICAQHPIDRGKIMLAGGSGGGHMALMMAAYAPQLWRAVDAWVPITDLSAWHRERATGNYVAGMEACCGGAPGASPEVDAEYRDRSPLSHVEALREVNLALHHGRYDQSVPYTHSWRLIQAMQAIGAPRFFFEIFNGRIRNRPCRTRLPAIDY
ncbi:MAG: prolyl oligopeptidase family serine peptidase [Lentisphaerae bacterium]|nr:prolyl oligopeptidase family serine peptidase [Lentisphaerota bacterium]